MSYTIMLKVGMDTNDLFQYPDARSEHLILFEQCFHLQINCRIH